VAWCEEELGRRGAKARKMSLGEALRAARDAVSAERVFGDAVERHGVTVIPVASVLGGGGGGGGEGAGGPQGQDRERGGGFGFGLWGRPVGAIEITERGIEWKPAPLDLTGVLMVSLIFAVPAALAAWVRHRGNR
jgi:uncharacterized spore protein YtfJ